MRGAEECGRLARGGEASRLGRNERSGQADRQYFAAPPTDYNHCAFYLAAFGANHRRAGTPGGRRRDACTPSRQDRERAGREADAILDLWPGYDDDGAGGRHLVEIRHRFDLVMILVQDPRLGIHRVGRVSVE